MTDSPSLRTHWRIPVQFDVGRLLEDYSGVQPADWQAREFSKPHQCRGQYADASLVAPTDAITGARSVRTSAYEPTPLLERSPYFQEVLSCFPGRLRHVRLSRMGPGARLATHIDKYGKYAEDAVRFHIPVVTNPDCVLFVAGQAIHLRPGECWYIDTHVLHAAANRGQRARVHLIIDCEPSDELKDLLGFDIQAHRKQHLRELHQHMKAYQRRESRWARLVAQTTPWSQTTLQA